MAGMVKKLGGKNGMLQKMQKGGGGSHGGGGGGIPNLNQMMQMAQQMGLDPSMLKSMMGGGWFILFLSVN